VDISNLDIFVLIALADAPAHGYAGLQDIRERSAGRVALIRACPEHVRTRFGAGMKYAFGRDLAAARAQGRRAHRLLDRDDRRATDHTEHTDKT